MLVLALLKALDLQPKVRQTIMGSGCGGTLQARTQEPEQ